MLVMRKIRFALLVLVICFAADAVTAQGVRGVWRTVDDNSGEDKSLVEITIRDGRLYGTVIEMLDKSEGDNPLCTECSGKYKNKPIVGMEVIRGLERRERRGNVEWYLSDGVLDPETGGIYNCRVWIKDNNTLYVRGYVGFLYRTQEWHRVR